MLAQLGIGIVFVLTCFMTQDLTMTATLNHCSPVAKKSFGKFMLRVFLIYVMIAAGEFKNCGLVAITKVSFKIAQFPV